MSELPRQVNANRARAAFTLVELLVVVALVALLLAVAVGGFGRARAAAQSAACRENLRLWGNAFHLYAAEHRGRFPHTDDRTRSDKSGLPASESPHDHSWVDELPPYMGLKPWRDHPEGQRPARNPWQCPAAHWAENAAYSYNREKEGGFSYAMNSYLSYDFDYGGRHGGESYLNTLRCEAPARTILLFDQAANPTDGLHPQYRNRKAGRHPGEDVTALTTRHRRGDGPRDVGALRGWFLSGLAVARPGVSRRGLPALQGALRLLGLPVAAGILTRNGRQAADGGANMFWKQENHGPFPLFPAMVPPMKAGAGFRDMAVWRLASEIGHWMSCGGGVDCMGGLALEESAVDGVDGVLQLRDAESGDL